MKSTFIIATQKTKIFRNNINREYSKPNVGFVENYKHSWETQKGTWKDISSQLGCLNITKILVLLNLIHKLNVILREIPKSF
jgi:hypothetical protein